MPKDPQLRATMLARRQAIASADRAAWDQAVQTHAALSPYFQRATTLLLYMPFRGEVATGALADTARAAGKRVVMPKVVRQGHELTLHLISGHKGDLAPGAYGIVEPQPHTPQVARHEIDLVVVPGVAFDRRGGRMGYGGGYYDRLLGDLPHAVKLGYAYELQILPQLPLERHDVRMDALVTEDGLFSFRQ